jgi:hypothetical protein
MGRYDYAGAATILEELAAARPAWVDNRVNLAIAVMNRQQDGDEQRALDLLRAVLAEVPDDPRALYVAGLLELRAGDVEAAAVRLARVVELDARDPYAAYFHGQAIELTDPEAALAEYERALVLEPYLRSAVYRAASVLRRTGQPDVARERLELFQRLDGNPQARSAEFVYTRMGDKAELIAPAAAASSDAMAAAPPPGPLFAAAVPLAFTPAGGANTTVIAPGDRSVATVPAIAAADLDGDGDVDLLVPRSAAGGAANLVLLREGDGWVVDDPSSPLSATDAVNAALLGDLDDDGDVDAYLLRDGENVLLLRDPAAAGGWRDVTASSGTGGGAWASVDGAMVDADHDGDLDLIVVNADGPDELFSHDLDGRYRSLGEASGLAASGAGSRRVLVEDLDADRDLDLVILRTDGGIVRRNDRLWDWRAGEEFAALVSAPLLAAVAADADADGRSEVYAAGVDGAVRRWSLDDGWSSAPPAAGEVDDASFAVVDVDGDGRPDLLSIGADGRPRVDPLPGSAGGPAEVRLSGGAGGRLTLIPGEAAAGMGVVSAAPGQDVQLHAPGPGRWPFLSVEVRGRTDAANSLRSNAAGIGTRYAARAGDRWMAGRFLRAHAGPGQGTERRFLGLGERPRLDFIELEWPDGVFQSEVHGAADPGAEPVSLAAGVRLEVEETQRQLSSCPVLFVWDGERWVFVSDLLGVGGLGYLVEPGVYAPPRPRERFLMPHGLPAPRDGRLAFKLHEPMEEVCYLDHAAIDAWDLPPGWDLVPDERLDLAPPAATGEPRFFRIADERQPVMVLDHRGVDVTETVLHVDDRAAPTPARDQRFIGRLTGEQVLTLRFDAPLAIDAGVPTLVIDGWVEYPYSQTNFAAWQADLAWEAPTVEARLPDGEWIVIAPQAGYPAGMPRRMSLPLPALPPGCSELRIRTNLECYFDRISVVPTVAAADVAPAPVHRRLDPVAATLRRSGFPARTTGPQQRPYYDYDDRRPFADMRALRGFHTAEGDVLALVAEIDDASAVLGPGEEVTIEVLAPPPPATGWTQRLVLDVAGWCKDMDLFTGDGETIEPMPSRTGERSAAAIELDERTRTRFRGGR